MKNFQGNVLFLILLAVALFAALSYAVTQSNRSGGNNITKEKAELMASELIQYAYAIEQAMMRMRLSGSYKGWQISVHSDYNYNSSENTSCPDNGCKLFHPEGGGLSPRLFPEAFFNTDLSSYQNPSFGQKLFFFMRTIQDVGTTQSDVYFTIGHIKDEICLAINKKVGIGNTIPTDSAIDPLANFSQTRTAYPGILGIIGDSDPLLAGQLTGCFYYNGSWGNQFYHVLIPR